MSGFEDAGWWNKCKWVGTVDRMKWDFRYVQLNIWKPMDIETSLVAMKTPCNWQFQRKAAIRITRSATEWFQEHDSDFEFLMATMFSGPQTRWEPMWWSGMGCSRTMRELEGTILSALYTHYPSWTLQRLANRHNEEWMQLWHPKEVQHQND